jgi:Transposase DDE domain group 1
METAMKNKSQTNRINEVGVTDDIITGRGGLVLFVRYLANINLLPLLDESFGSLRKSAKGLSVTKIFQQIFYFLFDGTSRHMSYFDALAPDEGYAAAIETDMKDMASSHTVKRFFALFAWCHSGLFRKILNQLFVWRLQLSLPRIVELAIDTMVMDNDEAQKRHGVQPTYKKKKGFQPLQMIWNSMIVDAVFRGGKKHSNYGNTVVNMIQRMVLLIRSACGEQVFIVIRMDSGFLDEKILAVLDELAVGFIVSGKMHHTVKEYVASRPPEEWGRYDHDRQSWEYLEFDWGCDIWDYTYRTFYTRPIYENGQGLLEFARPDNIIITNLDDDSPVLANCTTAERKHWLKPETIIESHHSRGADELPHRGLKDFGFEQLPFKRFGANSAFYYCMLIGFLLFESFKQDVSKGVIPVTSYATTVRRKLIDIAAKIVNTGHKVILKVSRAAMDTLQFATLWDRCNDPAPIPATISR